jgi:hypothetical protein
MTTHKPYFQRAFEDKQQAKLEQTLLTASILQLEKAEEYLVDTLKQDLFTKNIMFNFSALFAIDINSHSDFLVVLSKEKIDSLLQKIGELRLNHLINGHLDE